MRIEEISVTYPEEVTMLARSEQIVLAMTVVFFYDWILTLPSEISGVWSVKWRYTQWLYLGNRYFNWTFWLLSTIQLFIFPPSPSTTTLGLAPFAVCARLNFASYILAVLARLSSMGLFTLRIFAIYELNKLLLVSLCFIILSAFIVDWLTFYGVIEFVKISRVVGVSFLILVNKGLLIGGYCNLDRPKLATTWYQSLVWGSLVFDAFVFFLTVSKTWGRYRVAKEAARVDNSFHSYLLRDGSLYYLAVVILYILHVVLSFNGYLDDVSLSALASFNSVMEAIISCRLVLNLKRLSHSPSTQMSRSENQTSVLDSQFAINGFLGNIGAPLRSTEEEMDDFDEDIGVEHSESMESCNSDDGIATI